MIENMLTPRKMDIDSIVVKVGMFEAIMPMKKDVFDSVEKTQALVKKAVKRANKGQKVIIIGVGNSSGVGDDKRTVEKTKKLVEQLDKKYKHEEQQHKKRKGWF